MGAKQRTRGPQVHPTGPLVTVDNEWKTRVRAAMTAKGWDQKDLAREIPVSPATITNLFKPGPRQIRFKARVEYLLGWAVPSPLKAAALEAVNLAWDDLPDDIAAEFRRMVEGEAAKARLRRG